MNCSTSCDCGHQRWNTSTLKRKRKQRNAMENFVLVRNQTKIGTVDTPTGKQYDIIVRGVHGV